MGSGWVMSVESLWPEPSNMVNEKAFSVDCWYAGVSKSKWVEILLFNKAIIIRP